MAGMKCPLCARRTKVTDSRPAGEVIRRRRRCRACGHRFWTQEVVILAKKDETMEA